MNAVLSTTTGPVPADRELGVAEHFMWLMNRHHPNHSSIAVEVSGVTEPDQWRRALDVLPLRHAILRARIGAQPGGPRLTLGPPEPLPLQVAQLAGTTWSNELALQMLDPIDPATSPPLRATLLHSPERCAL